MNAPKEDQPRELFFSSPYRVKLRWIGTSGNEDVMQHLCSTMARPRVTSSTANASVGTDTNVSRLVLIDGDGKSGLTGLATEFERRLKRSGLRVLSLGQGTEADERYLLSNLVCELSVPYTRWNDSQKCLHIIHEKVLLLRSYDCLLIHDFQRFLSFSKYVTENNLRSLTYILEFSMKHQIFVFGDWQAIDICQCRFECYAPVRISLHSMPKDACYEKFVIDVVSRFALDLHLDYHFIENLHKASGGLVGETITRLQLLASGFSSWD